MPQLIYGKVSCEACKKKCKKEAVRLDEKYYHLDCFTCKECKKKLSTNGFYSQNGVYYCAEDYQKLFTTKCKACGEAASGEVVTVLGATYHLQCFHCTKCGKKFAAGEKVTFANNTDHWCTGCLKESEMDTRGRSGSRDRGASSPHKSPSQRVSSPGRGAEGVSDVEESLISSMNRSAVSASPDRYAENGYDNGVEGRESVWSAASGGLRSSAYNRNSVGGGNKKVFGIPDNNFYNISYLERTGEYRKVNNTVTNANKESLPYQHFHRPAGQAFSGRLLIEGENTLEVRQMQRFIGRLTEKNFSYKDVRKDFAPEKPEYLLKREKSDPNLKPIERDDWPGPPEPAAAYPELLREKATRRKSVGSEGAEGRNSSVGGRNSSIGGGGAGDEVDADGGGDEDDSRLSKDINELSKLSSDSGTAAVILKDLKKKRTTSPALDPRNASRTPSAATEPMSKTRYETPYFKSPSRDLDMLDSSHRRSRSRSAENRLRDRGAQSVDITRSGALSPRPGYTLRAGTSMDGQHDGYDRPQSSAGVIHSNSTTNHTSLSADPRRTPDEEYDPRTGLRHSYSSQIKSATLPAGLSASAYLDSRLTPIPRATEPVKIYTLKELTSNKGKQLPGVNKDALERHLDPHEFESVFSMPMTEFYRQPEWKRTDAKMKVGLI